MMITNKLKLDLQTPGIIPTIHAVQNDSYSRNLEIALFSDRKPFLFPENGTVVIRYKKSDGKGGEYDTLPDGSTAWWVERNILTVALAPQVLTVPGAVLLSVSLLADGTQLSVFPIRLAVEPIAAANFAKSENHFYITGLLPAPVSGNAGQYLRIASVNEQGRITAVDAVDNAVPQKGVDYWTDADRASMVQDVLDALGTPVFGTVDEENNIILTGQLPDGTYTLKYEDAEGTLTEIGTLTHSTGYTNLADPSGEEWIVDYRIKSDGSIVENTNNHISNFIPCQTGDVIRVKGYDICWNGSGGTRANVCFYAEDQETLVARMNVLANETDPNVGWVIDTTNQLYVHTVGESTYTIVNGSISDIRYVRFNGRFVDDYTKEDTIITVNQEIT